MIRLACPICDSPQFTECKRIAFDDTAMRDYLSHYYGGRAPLDDLAEGVYRLCQCESCGSFFQQDIFAEAGMDALYETWISPQESFAKKQGESAQVKAGFARQCEQVIRAVNLPPHDIHVLDFGMGWGTWLLMARAFGMQTSGLELSPSRVEHARKTGLHVVTPQEIAPDSLHFINAEQVFEHLAEPRPVLESCHRWLKKDGCLRISVPNGDKIASMLADNQWDIGHMPTIPLEHINTFTPHSLAQMGRAGGFGVVHAPIVLPMLSFNGGSLRQFINVLGGSLLARVGLYKTTTIWLKKAGETPKF